MTTRPFLAMNRQQVGPRCGVVIHAATVLLCSALPCTGSAVGDEQARSPRKAAVARDQLLPADPPPEPTSVVSAVRSTTKRRATPTARLTRYQLPPEELPAPHSAGLERIINKPIGQILLDKSPPPPERAKEVNLPDFVLVHHAPRYIDERRVVEDIIFSWEAPGTVHHPLYFEEVNLERHGYSCFGCVQPVASAAHFFGAVPLLPYKMVHQLPQQCVYTLGHYRPGNCVPFQLHVPPLGLKHCGCLGKCRH